MIRVFVNRVGFHGQTGEALVLLDEPQEKKVLPIWIGISEASAISLALAQKKSPRPLTHELLYYVVEDLGFQVDKVEITEIKDSAFYANVFLKKKSKRKLKRPVLKKIQARPSDAIALALQSEAPIYVSSAVLKQGSLPAEAVIRQSANDTTSSEDDTEFKQFLQQVKASDFNLGGRPPE